MKKWVIFAVAALFITAGLWAQDAALEGYWQGTKKSQIKNSFLFSGNRYIQFFEDGYPGSRGTFTTDSKGNVSLKQEQITFDESYTSWKPDHSKGQWYTLQEAAVKFNWNKMMIEANSGEIVYNYSFDKKNPRLLLLKDKYGGKTYVEKSDAKKAADYFETPTAEELP